MKTNNFNLKMSAPVRGAKRATGVNVAISCLLVFCGLALSACATSQTARDEIIAQRAQARWDAMLAGDFEKAYAYFSPGYRTTTSVTDLEISFRARRVQYTSARYTAHSCEEAVCTVKMAVGYKVVRPVAGLQEWEGTSLIEERWVNSAGSWWYLPEEG
jgi:hypothetical protein